MKKIILKFSLALILASAFIFSGNPAFSQQQEKSLTITTYYPTPYGVYKQLQVNDRVRFIGQISEPTTPSPKHGEIYFDTSIPSGRFRYYGTDNKWHDLAGRLPPPNLDTGWLPFPTRDFKELGWLPFPPDQYPPGLYQEEPDRHILKYSYFEHTLGDDANNYFVDIKFDGPYFDDRHTLGIMGFGMGGYGRTGGFPPITRDEFGRIDGMVYGPDTGWRTLTNSSISLAFVNFAPPPKRVRIYIWDMSEDVDLSD